MSGGISKNPLNDISQLYLDTVAKVKDAEVKQDIERWSVDEAKVDTGSAEAKASARNVRNTPPGKDSKFDTSVFITRKPGESLDSARTRKRRDAHAAKRGVKEDTYLGELKKSTLGSYVKKASKNLADRSFDHGESEKRQHEPDASTDREEKRLKKRQQGISRAADKLTKEEKAFDNVVAALRKKHGKDAVLTKDSPKPKAQPKAKPKPQKPLSAKEKAQREVDAQYGRTPWNKKGSLGT